MRTKKEGFSSWLNKYYQNNASLSLTKDREASVKLIDNYTDTLKPLEEDLKKILPLNLKSDIVKDTIARCQTIITNCNNSIKYCNENIKKIDKRINTSQKIKKEKNVYKQLMKHKHINNILVNDNNELCIITKSLNNHEKETLGSYLIKISYHLKPDITINNLDYI